MVQVCMVHLSQDFQSCRAVAIYVSFGLGQFTTQYHILTSMGLQWRSGRFQDLAHAVLERAFIFEIQTAHCWSLSHTRAMMRWVPARSSVLAYHSGTHGRVRAPEERRRLTFASAGAPKSSALEYPRRFALRRPVMQSVRLRSERKEINHADFSTETEGNSAN
jgi:hypothetical protein